MRTRELEEERIRMNTVCTYGICNRNSKRALSLCVHFIYSAIVNIVIVNYFTFSQSFVWRSDIIFSFWLVCVADCLLALLLYYDAGCVMDFLLLLFSFFHTFVQHFSPFSILRSLHSSSTYKNVHAFTLAHAYTYAYTHMHTHTG